MNREKNIGFQVRRLSNLIKRDIERSQTKFGISPVKGVNGWAISYFYENRKKDIFQKDFETHFSIRPSTASNILKTMEKKGLIERIAFEGDGRLKKIVITEKAIKLHEGITSEINAREKRLKKGVTDGELETFFKVINKFSNNMENEL